MEIKTKCLVIGSGPAGCTASIYLARSSLNPVLVSGWQPGGQLTITTDVENFPGFEKIQGPELMQKMQDHAKAYGTQIEQDTIFEVDFSKRPFICKGEKNIYIADSIIISTGASAKWLGLESEKKYQGFGVSGCATCDGFFFRNKEVAVIGGGNTALTEALHLSHHCSKVYMIHRKDFFRGEKILQEQVLKNTKIEIIWNHETIEILGEEDKFGKAANGIKLQNVIDKSEKIINLSGIFVAIGHTPNTSIFKNHLELDNEGYIIVNNFVKTSVDGVFAAGDVHDKKYRQAITSAGFGCIASLEAEAFLRG
jgi:thioredoxin reductase (NADPH)